MKTIIISFLSLLVTNISIGQTRDSISYPVVVQFNSECCGVPDAAPIKVYIRNFKKKHKLKKIQAINIGPMGREGEYWLAFSLTELTAKQAAIFKNGLKKVTDGLKKPGTVTLTENFQVIKSELGRSTQEKVVY